MTNYIPKPINETDKFFERLEKEGKVRNLNSSEDLDRQKRLNELCLETDRNYKSMNAGSIRSAREFYFTD